MNWCELLDRSSSGMHHDGHTPCYRVCRRRENVHLGFLFRGFNFRGSPVNRENRENWLPRKFPAIRYLAISESPNSQQGNKGDLMVNPCIELRNQDQTTCILVESVLTHQHANNPL